MKKIIATVLAMVMALALCTTAFADGTYTKAVDKDGRLVSENITVTANAGVYKKTNHAVATEASNYVDYYTVVYNNMTENYLKATSADYTLKVSADGKADMYLKKIATPFYYATATEFTKIGDSCGKLNQPTSGVYYAATYVNADDETVTEYYRKAADDVTVDNNTYINLLVDGNLVAVANTKLSLEKHDWKAASYDKDDNVATYKCKDCGTVATVYKTKDAAVAAGDSYEQMGTKWISWTDGKTAPSTDNKGNPSPKTFDAGIAMYVGMALTSVAGSAVVIGKKKEF